jgi:hypothetical protein
VNHLFQQPMRRMRQHGLTPHFSTVSSHPWKDGSNRSRLVIATSREFLARPFGTAAAGTGGPR